LPSAAGRSTRLGLWNTLLPPLPKAPGLPPAGLPPAGLPLPWLPWLLPLLPAAECATCAVADATAAAAPWLKVWKMDRRLCAWSAPPANRLPAAAAAEAARKSAPGRWGNKPPAGKRAATRESGQRRGKKRVRKIGDSGGRGWGLWLCARALVPAGCAWNGAGRCLASGAAEGVGALPRPAEGSAPGPSCRADSISRLDARRRAQTSGDSTTSPAEA
jgi:hypothetical protein